MEIQPRNRILWYRCVKKASDGVMLVWLHTNQREKKAQNKETKEIDKDIQKQREKWERWGEEKTETEAENLWPKKERGDDPDKTKSRPKLRGLSSPLDLFLFEFFFSGYICNSIEAYALTLKVCKACLRHAPAKPWTLRHTHYGANDFFFSPYNSTHFAAASTHARRMPFKTLVSTRHKVERLIPLFIFWITWKEHNKITFKDVEQSCMELKDLLWKFLFLWSRRESDSHMFPFLDHIDIIGVG